MKTLRGKAVSPGYAEGKAYLYEPGAHLDFPERTVLAHEVATEQGRLREAVARARRQLERIEQRVRAELGDSQAAIFTAHLALLEDEEFLRRIEDRIARQHLTAECAVRDEVEAIAERIASLDDPYLRERAIDVRDVGRRLIAQLHGRRLRVFPRLEPGAVLVAVELLPSDTVDLEREHVAGIVTELGGETSHAAILARALGVPAVTGIEDATAHIDHGAFLLVDGERGEVTIAPSAEVSRGFLSRKREWDRSVFVTASAEREACVTRDGVALHLYANIARPSEAWHVVAHHLEGVGLFRTECLFLESGDRPTLEQHVDLYRSVAQALGGRRLVIRTFDLGADKVPAFLDARALDAIDAGMRGLRFALRERELFETQVEAVVRVAQEYDVRVLFPMVLGVEDFVAARAIVRSIAGRLDLDVPPVGAMIEAPAALFALHEIMTEADFLSLGTNDLCQFMLAADRAGLGALDDHAVLHPAVLRAVQTVVHAAADVGRPLCVCGEAAGDPVTACLLAGLGIREFSMSPARAARVRFAFRAARVSELERTAEHAVRCRSIGEVQALLEETIGKPG